MSDSRSPQPILPTATSRFLRSAIYKPLKGVFRDWFLTAAFAEEIGVSIPTISQIVAALRERGHDIQAERTNKGWRYVLSHGTTARRAGLHAD